MGYVRSVLERINGRSHRRGCESAAGMISVSRLSPSSPCHSAYLRVSRTAAASEARPTIPRVSVDGSGTDDTTIRWPASENGAAW